MGNLELLRYVARGSIVTTPAMVGQYKGWVEVDKFTPYLGEVLVVLRKEGDDE